MYVIARNFCILQVVEIIGKKTLRRRMDTANKNIQVQLCEQQKQWKDRMHKS